MYLKLNYSVSIIVLQTSGNDSVAKTIGTKLKDQKKPNVPAPNAYNSEKSEEYLEGGIKHSIGVKLDPLKKFKTPAPNAYDSEKGEEYLEGINAITIGARLKEAKKFLTPAPNKYEVGNL